MNAWIRTSLPAFAGLHIMLALFHGLYWRNQLAYGLLKSQPLGYWIGWLALAGSFAALGALFVVYLRSRARPWRATPATLNALAMASLTGMALAALLV